MEDKLRNLKHEMDSKVFKEISFNRNASVKSILEGAEKISKPRWGYLHPLKKWFPEFTGILAAASVLFVLVNVVVDNYSVSRSEKTAVVKKETQNNKENDSIYVPAPKEEEHKELTKEEILNKMFNTGSYFDTAKGDFHLHYGGGGTPMDVTVQYELSIKQNGGVSKENYNGTNTITYYCKNKIWQVNEQEKYYRSLQYSDNTIADSDENKKLIDIDQFWDITVLSSGEIPPIGVAKESLFPNELVGSYIDNLNDITIEQQNEELLGHNTMVMFAKVKNRIIKNIRLWVDKDTGILVKYEAYNADGAIVDYLSPTKLELNVPIDSKKFTPNLEGYTDYDLIRKEQPQMTNGNIDELVPEELKSHWEEAKKNPNKTTLLYLNDKWYIFVKKGYLVNYIKVNGNEGELYLTKTSSQKAQYNYQALAEGYKVDTLKIGMKNK